MGRLTRNIGLNNVDLQNLNQPSLLARQSFTPTDPRKNHYRYGRALVCLYKWTVTVRGD